MAWQEWVDKHIREFEEDKAQLSGKQSQQREALKIVLVKKWRNPCEDFAMVQPARVQNIIFVHWCVWLFDIQQIAEFIKFSDIAIALNQPTKGFLVRTLFEFRYEEFYKWAYTEMVNDRFHDQLISHVLKDQKDFTTKYQQMYLALYFKVLFYQNKFTEAFKIGKQALEKGAKIKTEFEALKRKLKVPETA